MKAQVLNKIYNLDQNPSPLVMRELPKPVLLHDELLVKVSTCGVCHTELDEIEGRIPPPQLPIILGHQVVGRIAEVGGNAKKFNKGERVGIAWIYSACGECNFCRSSNENLCNDFKATGRDVNGGYAEYMTVREDFVFHLPNNFTDAEAAPLLCAGAIGYRSLKLTKNIDGQNLGLTGFGASAHLVLKMVKHRFPNTRIFVFARSEKERKFAIQLGAVWAGDTAESAPEKLNSIIDTTPVWKPIVEALKNLKPGGRLVINAIRKETVDNNYLLKLDYPTHLWMEKEIKSIANVTRSDVSEFLILASEMNIKPKIQEFSLEDANIALMELKKGKIKGAKVLNINSH